MPDIHARTLDRFDAHERVRSDWRRIPGLRDHADLLSLAESSEVLNFDPFRKLGWRLLEHQARDVLRDLLDPDVPHGLHSRAAEALLDAAIARPHLSPVLRRRARRVRDLVSRVPYRVEIEYRVPHGRIDIALLSPAFLVFIELKRSGGWETVAHGRTQLSRHLADLADLAKQRRIDDWLALFLAPKLPSARDCIAIPPRQISAALSRLKGRTLDGGGMAAFLGAYHHI